MHAGRSEPRINPMNFEMKLLNFLQSRGSENSVQSAQLLYPCSMLQERTLHQDALEFSWHPGHFSLRYDLQEPQYRPQYAMRLVSGTISFILSFLITFWSIYRQPKYKKKDKKEDFNATATRLILIRAQSCYKIGFPTGIGRVEIYNGLICPQDWIPYGNQKSIDWLQNLQ